jgi:hypothetical protein
VSYGQKRTAGYSIEVRDVFKRGTTLTIRAVLITPPEDMFQAQMITHPYVLLLVPREDYGRIQLMDEKGKVRMFKNL